MRNFLVFFIWTFFLQINNFVDDKKETSELKIISRKEWGALSLNGTLDDLVLPLSRIIICHTVTKECLTKVNYHRKYIIYTHI